jgi:hypothetical protein
LPGGGILNRLNIAGWVDTKGGQYQCEVCKKQVRLSLTELRIFPRVRADADILRFVYTVPEHKSGGAFSVEICSGSGKTLQREREQPTAMREGSGEETAKPEDASDKAAAEKVDRQAEVSQEEVKKKVSELTPQMAEERYNYLLSKSITDLTDEEYAERLALVERLTEKKKPGREQRSPGVGN